MSRNFASFFGLATGDSIISVRESRLFSEAAPFDFTDSNNQRFLRAGRIETDETKFDADLWAGSFGKLWFVSRQMIYTGSFVNPGPYYLNNEFLVYDPELMKWTRSVDGLNWQAFEAPIPANRRHIVYGNGVYVLTTTASPGALYTSTDLINWTLRSLAVTTAITSLIFANGLFVLGSYYGEIFTSADGITWTKRTTSPFVDQSVNDIKYTGALYIAVGGGGSINSRIATSPDGITWTSRYYKEKQGSSEEGAFTSLAIGNGLLIAANGNYAGNAMFAVSTDGINWRKLNIGWASARSGTLKFINGYFYIPAEGLRTKDLTEFEPINVNLLASGFESNGKIIVGTVNSGNIFQLVCSKLSAGMMNTDNTNGIAHVRIS
jgi:hypothetical protein